MPGRGVGVGRGGGSLGPGLTTGGSGLGAGFLSSFFCAEAVAAIEMASKAEKNMYRTAFIFGKTTAFI